MFEPPPPLLGGRYEDVPGIARVCAACHGCDAEPPFGWVTCLDCDSVWHRRCLGNLGTGDLWTGVIKICYNCARASAPSMSDDQALTSRLRVDRIISDCVSATQVGSQKNSSRAIRYFIDFALEELCGDPRDSRWWRVLPRTGPLNPIWVSLFLDRASDACGAFGTFESLVSGIAVFHAERGCRSDTTARLTARHIEGVARRLGRENRIGRGPKLALPFQWLAITVRYILEIAVPAAPLGDLGRTAGARYPHRHVVLALRAAAILVNGFFGLLRPSEILGIDEEHWNFGEGYEPLAMFDNLPALPLWLILPWSKMDPRRCGAPVGFSAMTESGIAIRAIITMYARSVRAFYGANYVPAVACPDRGTPFYPNLLSDAKRHAPPEPLSTTAASRHVSGVIREWVPLALKHAKVHWNMLELELPTATALAGSSLRRGGASHMQARGVSEEERQQHGRWLSVVNRQYVAWSDPMRLGPTQRC